MACHFEKLAMGGNREYVLPVTMYIHVLVLPETSGQCGDGKMTVFDAQILEETAGLRTLTDEELAAIGTLT